MGAKAQTKMNVADWGLPAGCGENTDPEIEFIFQGCQWSNNVITLDRKLGDLGRITSHF